MLLGVDETHFRQRRTLPRRNEPMGSDGLAPTEPVRHAVRQVFHHPRLDLLHGRVVPASLVVGEMSGHAVSADQGTLLDGRRRVFGAGPETGPLFETSS